MGWSWSLWSLLRPFSTLRWHLGVSGAGRASQSCPGLFCLVSPTFPSLQAGDSRAIPEGVEHGLGVGEKRKWGERSGKGEGKERGEKWAGREKEREGGE